MVLWRLKIPFPSNSDQDRYAPGYAADVGGPRQTHEPGLAAGEGGGPVEEYDSTITGPAAPVRLQSGSRGSGSCILGSFTNRSSNLQSAAALSSNATRKKKSL